MQPLLSVVIPLFNSERYIEHCLSSILNSSYQNLEVVVVDDKSTDNGLHLVYKMKEKDNRIVVIEKKNQGVSAARNAGIRETHGKYITFVDADDYIESNTYDIVMNALLSKQTDAAIYATVRELEGKHVCEPLPWQDGEILNKERIRHELLPFTLEAKKGETWVSGSVWRLVFIANKLDTYFDEHICYREDQLFCVGVYAAISSIVICNQAKYHYVKHSVTTTEKYRNHFFTESMECEQKIIDLLKKNELFEGVLDHYKIQRLSTYSLCISNLYRCDAPSSALEELPHILHEFKKDTYMHWSLSEFLKLRKKYMFVLLLLKSNCAILISRIYTHKEKKRQQNLMR